MAEDPSAPLITDEMTKFVGQESAPTTLEVDQTMVRLFARAVGHGDPVYYDEAAAIEAGYRSLPCPPGYLGTPIFDPNVATARQAVPEPSRPLTSALNGGTEIEYFDDICAGDVLVSTWHVSNFEERAGSLGAMLITTMQTVYRRDGEVVAIATGTGIRY